MTTLLTSDETLYNYLIVYETYEHSVNTFFTGSYNISKSDIHDIRSDVAAREPVPANKIVILNIIRLNEIKPNTHNAEESI